MTQTHASAQQDTRGIDEALLIVLDELALDEERFVERLYARFFDLCPEATALFGPYPLAEQEEMVRETFRSLLGLIEEAPWVEGNLVAMGNSHVEYGVEAWMYAPFEDAFLETLVSTLGRPVGPEVEHALRSLITRITSLMKHGTKT